MTEGGRPQSPGGTTVVYAADWVLPVLADPIRDGAVAIAGGTIVSVGSRGEILAASPGAAVEDLPGCVLAPGFVNLHTHIEYSSYAGFGDGLPFGLWMADHIRRKGRLEPGDDQALALLGARACLRSGVTTIIDASFSGAAVPAATEAGLRAVVALEAFGGSGADARAVADALDARVATREAEAGPLVELGVSPHAPYTVAPHVYEEVVGRARLAGRRVVTHVAESANELAALVHGEGPLVETSRAFGAWVQPFGRHPVAELVARGLLGPETIVAHAVHVGLEEIELLAGSGCVVAHCPRSNALLGCGAAPLVELRAAGVPVGLGTDSPASALTFDLFDELRAAVMVARACTQDPAALTAHEALRLATLDAATALGVGYRRGALAPGFDGDVVAVELRGTTFDPADDPVSSLVLGGAPERVVLTLVAGRVRHRRGDGAYEAALDGATSARARMLGPR